MSLGKRHILVELDCRIDELEFLLQILSLLEQCLPEFLLKMLSLLERFQLAQLGIKSDPTLEII